MKSLKYAMKKWYVSDARVNIVNCPETKDFFHYKNGKVFIDCGAYDGDTIYRFKRLMKKRKLKPKAIIGVEADEHNGIKLQRHHSDVKVTHGGMGG